MDLKKRNIALAYFYFLKFCRQDQNRQCFLLPLSSAGCPHLAEHPHFISPSETRIAGHTLRHLPIKHQQLIGDNYKDTPRARDSLGWGPSAPQNYRWMQRFYLMQHRTSPALCLGSVRDGGDPASPGLVLGASRGNCQDPGSMDFMGARVGCQG